MRLRPLKKAASSRRFERHLGQHLKKFFTRSFQNAYLLTPLDLVTQALLEHGLELFRDQSEPGIFRM